MDVAKRLTHVGQFSKQIKDKWGATSASTVVTVACYAYFGAYEQQEGNQTLELEAWQVLLPVSLTSIATIGDCIKSVKDCDGMQLFASMQINDVRIYSHRKRGTEVVVAILEPQ